jgi:hypothetical protein
LAKAISDADLEEYLHVSRIEKFAGLSALFLRGRDQIRA